MVFDPIAELRKIDPSMRPILRRGVKSAWWVRLYRRCLGAAGFDAAMLCENQEPEFSSFDWALDEVTRFYQAGHGLIVDGEAGPVSWASLAAEELPAPRPVADKPDSLSLQVRQSIVHVAKYGADVLKIREEGKNAGPVVEMILEHAGGQKGWPWCAAFVHACIDVGYLLLGQFTPDMPIVPGIPELSCSMIYRWARDEGRLGKQPRPGDVYLFAGGESGWYHTGLIEDIKNDGTLVTIEGNTSADPKSIREDADGDGVYHRKRQPDKYPGAVVSVS